MSGNDFLLDTSVLVGFFAGRSEAHRLLSDNGIRITSIAVSQITRIELLASGKLEAEEEAEIRSFLDRVRVIAISQDVEDATIKLRRLKRLKLPDALIVATALVHKLRLMTFDEAMLDVFEQH